MIEIGAVNTNNSCKYDFKMLQLVRSVCSWIVSYCSPITKTFHTIMSSVTANRKLAQLKVFVYHIEDGPTIVLYNYYRLRKE